MNPTTLAAVRPATSENLTNGSNATGDRFCRALAGYTRGMQQLSGALDLYHDVLERTRVLAGRTGL